MLQPISDSVIERLKAIGALATQFAGWFVVAFALFGLLALGLYAIDREAYARFQARAIAWLKLAGGWALLAVLLWFETSLIRDIRGIQLDSLEAQSESDVVSTNDPDVPSVLQYGPLASYLQEKTYTRTLTLPPSFLDQVGAAGVQTLSPYLQDPSAENVLELIDTFRKSGKDVVFTRQVKKLEETPIPIQDADIQVHLAFEGDRAEKRSAYRATFEGKYAYKNPLDTQATVRFTFNLPPSATSVQGFSLKVGTTEVREPDEHGNYRWEGSVAPGSQVLAQVRYETLGSGSWSYDVGSSRRRIENFSLRMRTDRAPRFTRTAIFPTSREAGDLVWKLKDVITAQRIDVVFPTTASLETLAQAWTLYPFALMAFVALVALALWLSKSPILPLRILVGMSAMFLGLALTVALVGVLGVALGVAACCVLGGLGGAVFLRKGWVAAFSSAAIPLTALSAEYTGLWLLALTIATAAAMLVFVRKRVKTT